MNESRHVVSAAERVDPVSGVPTDGPRAGESSPPHRSKSAHSGARGRLGSSLWTPGSVLGGLILWEAIARIWRPSFLPPASSVAQRLWELSLDGEIFGHLATSLINLVIGFLISAVVGLAVGVLMARYPLIGAALEVYVYALLTAPVLVFAPIFFAIFGLRREAIIAVVITYTIFVVIINTADGVKSAPRDLLEMAESYNATEWQTVRFIIMPAAGPMIMAGLRLGMGRAVKGMINGEMFIAVVGLGGFVRRAGQTFDSTQVLAIVVLIVAVALLMSAAVSRLEARVTFWLPSTSRD